MDSSRPSGELTLAELKIAARSFVHQFTAVPIPSLYGMTDGKAVGTHVEHAFHEYLRASYAYVPGNAALGIDLPELGVDLKVTSVRQPQSSSPFRDAGQKVFGLGYHLLVFIYEKVDDHDTRMARLHSQRALFIDRSRTADYQTSYGLLGILSRDGNREDIVAFLEERNLPLDEIGRGVLADRILATPPALGYLTISNAFQWRLQYGRAITAAVNDSVSGVENLLA